MPPSDNSTSSHKVIRTTLHEPRRIGRQKKPCPQPQQSRPASDASRAPVASPLAQRLALAYAIERAIESGRVKNLAEVSRRLGITRARATQIMALLHLPVSVQEELILGKLITCERKLRAQSASVDWRA
jgi:hypothetical protein